MSVQKNLLKFAGAQALNSEYASAWTEATRGQTCSSGTNDEINIAIPTGHTILYVYPDERSRQNAKILYTKWSYPCAYRRTRC